MYCQHCGNQMEPTHNVLCPDCLNSPGKKEANYCYNCGEPFVGKSYYHECGKHQLKNFWTQSLHYRGVYD